MKFLSIAALAALFYSAESLKMLRQDHWQSTDPAPATTDTTTDPTPTPPTDSTTGNV